MSTSSNGGPGSPSSRENDAVREESTAPSTSGGDSAGRSGFDAAGSIAEATRVSPAGVDKPVEARFPEDFNESTVSRPEETEIGISDASGGDAKRNQPISSISRFQNKELKKTKKKKVKGPVDDYDSMLSEFDHFAAKGANEAVGYGYEIGDMVWGKVKSHPWWPGHIYNEAHASPSVQRSKREGHVLVAFFGDSSYGWYDPAELIPFEENFAEKSLQTSSRPFLKAVGEAVDELSRRRGLGLACRCRNEFNFWPSSVEDYFVVDVGDFEPVVYSMSLINKARTDFHPNEMLSFVKEMALTPMTHQHRTIEFIKNKATALACRRALFEEFDETYAQAFGTVPVRPPRPTAPVSVNPSRAPLSGRLVIAEALGKKKYSIKPTKTKDQVEKDKYIFKRRDEPVRVRTKKTSLGQSGSAYPLLVDGSGLSGTPKKCASVSDISDGQCQSTNQASVVGDIKPMEGSEKILEVKLPLADSNIGEAVEKVSGMPLDIPLSAADNQLDNQKNDDLVALSSSSESKRAIDLGKEDLPVLLKDLHALAINPLHGVERSCQATVVPLFLKYRSLVYQKSLVLLPPGEIEKCEANSSKAPSTTALRIPAERASDKLTMKLKRTLIRPDDPTKGGRKRGPSIRPDVPKKKRKLDDSEDISKRKKLIDSEDNKDIKKKKKMIDDSKLSSVEKKTVQRSNEPQRGDVKEIRAKNVFPASTKVAKLESGKRMQQPVRVAADPTMLVMKFPPGAALPSGAHLRAKFARFGPLDHSATRVFWETYTCRLVYQRKADAEAALEFTVGSGNLFGSRNVRSYIREVRDKAAAEVEAVKFQKEEMTGGTEQRTSAAARIPVQSHQQVKIKSCLKKASNEEVGNGNGRGTRVTFVLGGEGGSNAEQASSNAEGASSYTHSTDHVTINMPGAELLPKNDISQQLLNLLTRCRDVVNNLTGAFGYVPYHSL
ncbi:Tudor/PWWP/MBT superfamily protein [Perilla frutescens var. frutescens]|nr:Tudor/PWWP/MBT superfamily protein [Perilla frutescens var. frutescens]